MINGFVELADQHGLLAAVIVAALGSHYWMIWWLVRMSLKTKDQEIDRLVKERNWLQKQLFPNRLSTKPAKASKGKKKRKKGEKK